MAFISILSDGSTYEERSFIRDQSRATFVTIGYHDADPISYQMMVDIGPSQRGTELTFCLVEVIDGHQPREIFDSAEAGRIIPRYCRPQVRAILLKMIESIIRVTGVSECYMVTFCANLPDKALKKYDEICDVFKACGFKVIHDGPSENGRHIWMMSRIQGH